MRWRDGERDFGWISIALHWLGAGVVLTMLFVGSSIEGAIGQRDGGMLRLHTTIGLGFYLVLVARIAWRVREGHPGPLPRQKAFYYSIGKVFHYVLIGAIAVMLLSGPLMAASGGIPLRFFDLLLPVGFHAPGWVFASARAAHLAAGTVLGWGTLIHIVAVIKHTAVDRDGAFDKIMVPLDRPSRSVDEA